MSDRARAAGKSYSSMKREEEKKNDSDVKEGDVLPPSFGIFKSLLNVGSISLAPRHLPDDKSCLLAHDFRNDKYLSSVDNGMCIRLKLCSLRHSTFRYLKHESQRLRNKIYKEE